MKKLFAFIIAFSLCACIFNTQVFAVTGGGGGSDSGINGSDVSDYNSWSTHDKVQYWTYEGLAIVSTATGIVKGTGEIKDIYDAYMTDATEGATIGYSTFAEFAAAHSHFNEDTQHMDLDSDFEQFLNFYIGDYNSKVTLGYYYGVSGAHIDASSFPSADLYNEFVKLVHGNPDYGFYIRRTAWQQSYSSSLDTYIYIIYGLKNVSGVSNSVPFSAIKNVTFYDNSNWNQKYPCAIAFNPSNKSFYVNSRTGSSDNWKKITDYDVDSANPVFAYTVGDLPPTSAFTFSLDNPNIGSSWNVSTYYSDSALPIYKSLADMKNGTTNNFVGEYSPGYTGQPIINITLPDLPSYNPGGGSGDDDDSGGGSGSGGSGGGLGDLLSGIGKFFDSIASVLGKIIEGIGSLISSIVSAITDLIDLLSNDVLDFFSSIFAFLPPDLMKAIFSVITLALLFGVIRIIRG